MASCITSMWTGSVCPQARLTVTQSSETNTTATLKWTLEYVTHGYTANTNGNGRAWSVTIDGSNVDSGTTNIDGKSTYTVASGTKTVNKAAARSVSFSLSFEFDITWSDVYGGTKTASSSISISAAKYTVSFSANGGSGAPSSQTKTHGTDLTLHSTTPKRTGYTFEGWALSKADADAGTWYYAAGSTCGRNADTTLYAVWQENVLTVNHHSNKATSATGDSIDTGAFTSGVDSLIYTVTYGYTANDNLNTYGLGNYSNSTGSLYMTRIGYTATGNWGSSASGGTSVNENDTFVSGQALAEKFGLSLEEGNATINIYAQWRENTLTVKYHSNYATDVYRGAENEDKVNANSDVVIKTSKFGYDESITSGLHNYSTAESEAYLARTRYNAVGYWGTTKEVYTKDDEDDADGIITNNAGIAISEDNSFESGQALAQAFGLTLVDGDKSIDLYAQWILLASRVTIYGPDRKAQTGICCFYYPDYTNSVSYNAARNTTYNITYDLVYEDYGSLVLDEKYITSGNSYSGMYLCSDNIEFDEEDVYLVDAIEVNYRNLSGYQNLIGKYIQHNGRGQIYYIPEDSTITQGNIYSSPANVDIGDRITCNNVQLVSVFASAPEEPEVPDVPDVPDPEEPEIPDVPEGAGILHYAIITVYTDEYDENGSNAHVVI